MNSRGYFGVGIADHKTPVNLGVLWRSAYCFGAAFIFTIAKRYPQHLSSDTTQTWRHVPLYEYASADRFWEAVPRDCEVVGVELGAQAHPLERFQHRERAIYLLGAEDHGLAPALLERCDRLVQIESRHCLNVAVAGSLVMWHRQAQRNRE